MKIIDRIVVLFKDADRVFITKEIFLPLNCIAGNVSSGYSMWRVKSHDEYDGVIVLRPEKGICRGAQDFNISSNTNSPLINSLCLKKIIAESNPRNNFFSVPNPGEITFNEEQMQMYEKTFAEPITQFTFKDGKACLTVNWHEQAYHKEVEISNPFLKQEHEAIKHYFEQFFDAGLFNVKIAVGKKGGKIEYENAFSDDISKISNKLIRKIEYASSNSGGRAEDDSITHIEKVPEQEAVPVIENVETLITFLADNPSKHFNHLTYLSQLQEGRDFKLRTTSEPISFLFSFRADRWFYMVWESHDTPEATYIWRFPLNDTVTLEQHLLNTENLLKDLRNSQKREYRKSRKNDPDFHVIEHDYQKEDHGFQIWKLAVEKYIHSI